MSGRHRPREPRRDSESDSDSDSGFAHIQCWIPSANVDLAALAAYLKEYIDDTATIQPSNSPNDASKPGYTITAKNTLNMAQVRDLIEDSRAWGKEKLTREYRKDPYGYHESDVWEKRKETGATVSEATSRRRRRRVVSPPPHPTTQTTSRHETTRNRDASPDVVPVRASVGTGALAQRQQPSIAAVSEYRHGSTTNEKDKAQFTPRAMQATISNMSKSVAKDRHNVD